MPPDAVQARGSHGVRDGLEGEGGWNPAAAAAVPGEPCVVDVLVDPDDVLVDPDDVPLDADDVPLDADDGAFTPNCVPVTTVTWAPSAVGASTRVTAPLSWCITVSAAPSVVGLAYSTSVSDWVATGVEFPTPTPRKPRASSADSVLAAWL